MRPNCVGSQGLEITVLKRQIRTKDSPYPPADRIIGPNSTIRPVVRTVKPDDQVTVLRIDADHCGPFALRHDGDTDEHDNIVGMRDDISD